MIKFVYFDLGNVLWTFDESLACSQAAEQLGVTAEQVRDALYESGLQTRFETGQVSPAGVVDELAENLGIANQQQTMDAQAVLDAASDMFTPIESMVDVLGAVRRAGIGVGILSNTCRSHWDWIGRQHHPLMAGTFNAVVLSFEVASMKPDDQIYRAAELMVPVTNNQILFLDDKAENVAAARQRGWQAEVCLGGQQAIEVLHRHGVLGEFRAEG